MTEKIDSQLSMLLDGELSAGEAELLLRRLATDESLRQKLGRYAAIGEAMRDSAVAVLLDGSLAARVGESIRGEPALRPGFGRRFGKLLAGAAVAASVATVALLSLQPSVTTGPLELGRTGVGDNAASYTVPDPYRNVTSSRPDRLEYYLIHHGDFAPLARKSAYTRVIAGPDKRRPETAEKEPEAKP